MMTSRWCVSNMVRGFKMCFEGDDLKVVCFRCGDLKVMCFRYDDFKVLCFRYDDFKVLCSLYHGTHRLHADIVTSCQKLNTTGLCDRVVWDEWFVFFASVLLHFIPVLFPLPPPPPPLPPLTHTHIPSLPPLPPNLSFIRLATCLY